MTTWQPDLSREAGPRYLAIANLLARDLAAGRLKPGDRMPTHRELAWKLGVTVGTVTRAYAEAERRGLIAGEVGRGTFIRERGMASDPEPPPSQPEAQHAGFIDLARNFPTDLGQSSEVARVLGELAQANDLDRYLSYSSPAGLPAHREAGAAWQSRGRFAVDPAEVVVTDGAQHALLAALAGLARPGDTILTESLTFYGAKSIAGTLALKLHGVAGDGDGLLPDALDAACRQTSARALYTIPTLQNPTTTTMPPARREAVAAVCRRHGVAIIEDDSYGFLPPDPPTPLTAYAPELAIYLVSLSKPVVPGLRIGFLRAPPAWVDRIAGAVRASVWMASPLIAELSARLIRSGAARRMADAQRAEAVARQSLARRLLAGFEYAAPPHAVHVWLTLPEPWRREEFALAARKRGIRVASADAFAIGRASVPHAVRIGLSAPRERAQVERALGELVRLLREGPGGGMAMV